MASSVISMHDAKKKLVELGKELVKQIENKKNPCLDIPIRSLSNVRFNSKKKVLELGTSRSKRYFFNVGHVKKFVQTTSVAATTKELLDVGKHLSLREVFYRIKRTIPGTKINVVDEQEESNQAVEDLEVITKLPREQLHINADRRGSVAGKVIIEDRGDIIDWSKLGSGGWSIPSNVEEIKFKRVSAKYVIFVEKSAEFERMLEDKVWEKMNCIIMCSQGQATRGVRRLLQRLSVEHNLPILVMCDFDSWGFYIYSVIKYGSISLAHMSDKLAVPKAKYLGLTADDIEKYDLKRHLIRFKDIDLKRLKQISEYEWFKDNKKWQKQFEMMKKKIKGKIELAALTSRGISFLSDVYLPEKIKNKDWIE